MLPGPRWLTPITPLLPHRRPPAGRQRPRHRRLVALLVATLLGLAGCGGGATSGAGGQSAGRLPLAMR
jgi:hypothetical protein